MRSGEADAVRDARRFLKGTARSAAGDGRFASGCCGSRFHPGEDFSSKAPGRLVSDVLIPPAIIPG